MLRIFSLFCLFLFPMTAQAGFVALGASAVEISWALGAGNDMLARSTWDVWPPQVLALPDAGEASRPNLELLIALKPDFVLADAHYASLIQRLEDFGIPVHLIYAYNRQDLPQAVRLAAKLFGKEEQGEKLLHSLAQVEARNTQALADLTEVDQRSGMMLAGQSPYFSFSSASGRTVLQDAGALNVCDDLSVPYPILSLEWILFRQPDFILIAPEMENAQGARKGTMEQKLLQVWQQEKGFLRMASPSLLVMESGLTFGLRSAFGSLFLAQRLYPQLFGPQEAQNLYAGFLQEFFQISSQGKVLIP